MEMLVRDIKAKLHNLRDKETLKALAMALETAGVTVSGTRKATPKAVAQKISRALEARSPGETIDLNGFQFSGSDRTISSYQRKQARKTENAEGETLPLKETKVGKTAEKIAVGFGSISAKSHRPETVEVAPVKEESASQMTAPVSMSFWEFVDIHAENIGVDICERLLVEGDNWHIRAQYYTSKINKSSLLRILHSGGNLPKGIDFAYGAGVSLRAIQSGSLYMGTLSLDSDQYVTNMRDRMTTARFFRKLYEMRESVHVISDE